MKAAVHVLESSLLCFLLLCSSCSENSVPGEAANELQIPKLIGDSDSHRIMAGTLNNPFSAFDELEMSSESVRPIKTLDGEASGEINLEILLSTGVNAYDRENSWHCTTHNVFDKVTEISLELWSDFTGRVGDVPMQWKLIDEDSVNIYIEGQGVVRLTEIEFESIARDQDFFTAVDNLGEISSCRWTGMVRQTRKN